MVALDSIAVPLTKHEIDNSQFAHLHDLQGNILKGHGRNHAAHLFLKFKDGRVDEAREWLNKHLKPRITNAYHQIKAAEAFKKTGKDAGIFYAFLLSASGYEYFGKDNKKKFSDLAFQGGAKSRTTALNDPDKSDWEVEYQADIHAMVLIADVQSANVRFLARELKIELSQPGSEIADVIHTEFGDQQFNERGNGIEHFGYVDGRSQPLMLETDLEGESDGISLWDPRTGPAQVLIPDPFGNAGATGSYFVFRKLEEKVKAFKTHEQLLANKLGLVGEARELAGALVIGRFEDGTPVTLSNEPLIESSPAPNNHSVPNNFDYSTDAGIRCPFHSHIRKSNPRGVTKSSLGSEKPRHMARRGITYGKREEDSFEDLDKMPEGGVGLLFMSYQQSIVTQFEFIQSSWVNAPGFPSGGAGLDPVIGQGGSSAPAPQKWPQEWDKPASGTVDFDFKDFVVLKGGEYFFAPSLSGIGNL